MAQRLVVVEPGRVEWQSFEATDPKPNQVRIRSEFGAAKHGTEMAFYKGYAAPRGSWDAEWQLFKRREAGGGSPGPLSPGNMIVGRVEAVGSEVTSLKVGDRVCTWASFTDSVNANVDRCWKMPQAMSWKSAVCLDPLEFVLGAMRDGNVRVGDAVAIFGLGAIGLIAVQAARLAGAEPIIALDPFEKRRAIAIATGATHVLDPKNCDAGLEIRKLTEKRGADVVIEYSGAAGAMNDALRGVAYGGTVVAGAFPPPYAAGLDFGAESHMNIPRIVFSRACSQPDRDHPRWDEARIFKTCWQLLAEDRINGEKIVDPVVSPSELPAAYARIATNPDESVKLGVKF